jgi:hypothetical protein
MELKKTTTRILSIFSLVVLLDGCNHSHTDHQVSSRSHKKAQTETHTGIITDEEYFNRGIDHDFYYFNLKDPKGRERRFGVFGDDWEISPFDEKINQGNNITLKITSDFFDKYLEIVSINGRRVSGLKSHYLE